MPKYCGDEANLEYQVDANKIGCFATIVVQRLDRKTITTYGFQEITATKTKMKWPDQEDPNGGYFGGRQVDFKGLLKKSYADKFAKQNFTITVTSEDESKNADNTEIIDELPAKSQKPMTVPSPVCEMWIRNPLAMNPATGALGPQTYSPPANPIPAGSYQDKFDIEFKDGFVLITVRINLASSVAGKSVSGPFKYIKKRVESFWNSEACGYNQWVYHRTNCKRGDSCSCKVLKNSKGKYISAGCCKVPFKVKLEQGGANANSVTLHYLNLKQRLQVIAHEAGLDDGWGARNLAVPVDTSNFYYPENRQNTYAHEVGHMMGFPDQYEEGVTVQGAMSAAGGIAGAAWPIDDSSVMGRNQGEAKLIHVGAQWFRDFMNTVDSSGMAPIPK